MRVLEHPVHAYTKALVEAAPHLSPVAEERTGMSEYILTRAVRAADNPSGHGDPGLHVHPVFRRSPQRPLRHRMRSRRSSRSIASGLASTDRSMCSTQVIFWNCSRGGSDTRFTPANRCRRFSGTPSPHVASGADGLDHCHLLRHPDGGLCRVEPRQEDRPICHGVFGLRLRNAELPVWSRFDPGGSDGFPIRFSAATMPLC